MNDALNRRCALFLLVAMTMALAVGLLALGPMPIPDEEHHHAGDFSGFGHAINVLAPLPMLVVALLGWASMRRSGWPAALTRPWKGSFVAAMVMAVMSAIYHVAPDHPRFVASNVAAAAVFMLLLAGFLAERVNPAFGTRRAVAATLAVVAAAGLFTAGSLWWHGEVDLRPLLLMQMLPTLLIPAGALSLAGPCTRRRTWALVLGVYIASRVIDLFDTELLHLTGWIGGHALMHLGFAATLAGLAYVAYRACCVAPAVTPSPVDTDVEGDSHFSTSLNTSG